MQQKEKDKLETLKVVDAQPWPILVCIIGHGTMNSLSDFAVFFLNPHNFVKPYFILFFDQQLLGLCVNAAGSTYKLICTGPLTQCHLKKINPIITYCNCNKRCFFVGWKSNTEIGKCSVQWICNWYFNWFYLVG